MVRVDGSYDVSFTPRVENPLEQSRLMDELRGRYAAIIQDWTLSVNVRMYFLSRDYLIGAKRRKAVLGSYSAQEAPFEPDALGRRVLEELAARPRAAGAEIARTCGVSTETVLSRIRLLEKERVLVRYMTVLDNQVLGRVNYYVLVYLSHLTPEREQAFARWCAQHPNVVYLIKSLGAWDYELSVEVASGREYRAMMMDMTREFSDIIRQYSGMVVHEICKYVYP